MPNKRPDGVVPSDEAVEIFYRMLADVYAEVSGELKKATEAKKLRRAAIKKQIEELLKEADQDVKAWIKVEIPAFYEAAMFEAVKTQFDQKLDIKINQTFVQFHRESIAALSSKTYESIASGMDGILRDSLNQLSNITRRRILDDVIKGRIKGETRREISKNIVKQLRKDGLAALTDRSGKRWDLRVYGRMLSRTVLTEAHYTGIANQTLSNGYDLIQVSKHSTSCPICAPWQGRILSVSGINKKYPSLDDARAAGLFHPNCRHAIAPYHPRFAEESLVWDAKAGKYVEFKSMNYQARSQNFNQILKDYKKMQDKLGLSNIPEIRRLINKGDRQKLGAFISKINDPALTEAVGKLLKYF